MELAIGPDTSSGCPAARKRRSEIRRRPHSDIKQITNWQHSFTLPSLSTDFRVNGVGQTFQSCILSSIDAIKSNENHQDRLKNPSVASDLGNENKLKKVKLKLGGITRTLHANSPSEIDKQKQDISRNTSGGKESSSRRTSCPSSPAMSENYNYKLVQKISRSSRKRAVDEGFDDEDDEEIRYLKKLRASRAYSGYAERLEEGCRKTKGISKIMGLTVRSDSSGFDKGGRQPRIYDDNDYEKELDSDDELKDKKKRMAEDLADSFMGSGNEMTMTTRKRALECLDAGGHLKFPNGLPEAPSKKQKLSEVEQQLRKAEAAERRRSQAEKAARKAEAEVIRKILGQDSNRKKEEKLKRQQEELAQEKTGKAAALGPSTVRYIMRPQGTVVTFSEDLGLPKIFDPQPCGYPPPREKCVGPNCTNEYKYRDSKSKLPLCSLTCYKAVQGNTELLPAF